MYDTDPLGRRAEQHPEPSARLEIDDAGGKLVLRGSRKVEIDHRGINIGARMPEVTEVVLGGRPVGATLGITDDGRPFLRLGGRDKWVRIDESGISVGPDKAGFDTMFVAEHPDQPGKSIRYCVAEGPEVGVFVRGTAKLVNGHSRVALPEHFGHVASPERLTVQLTPRSADSLGLAATVLTTRELEIRELHKGSGGYEVDYLIQGIRAGRESFEVVVEHARPPEEQGEVHVAAQ